MSLNTELEKRAPATSWWAHAKDRPSFKRALAARMQAGMMTVPTPTFGLSCNTATMIAKRRKRDR